MLRNRDLLPILCRHLFRGNSRLCTGRVCGRMARSQIRDLALICFGRCVWNTVWTLAITCPANDVRRINSFLSLPWIHCDIHLHSRTVSHVDSRDRDGDRVCVGTNRCRDNAFSFWTFIRDPRQIAVVFDHRPDSHHCLNCGSRRWSTNSRKAASRGIVRRRQRPPEWLTGNLEGMHTD